MESWIIKEDSKVPKLNNPILLEGLPGIGNVGKIAIDFVIDELKPKEVCTIFSHTFPHSVLIDEDDLVTLPCVKLYYAQQKGKRDLLILGGDVQPLEESSSYVFSEKILDLITKHSCKELVTVGGIGLPGEPKKPEILGTATDKTIVSKYKKNLNGLVNFKVDGRIGTIVGATGLLLGLGRVRNISGVSILVETFNNPFHLGLKEAHLAVECLEKISGWNFNSKRLGEEIRESEESLQQSKKAEESQAKTILKRLKSQFGDIKGDTSYIG